MERSVARVVDVVHASRVRCSLALAGGGARALAWLIARPNASKTLIECAAPYAREATDALLGLDRRVSSYASAACAEALSEAAYERAVRSGSSRTVDAARARATVGLGAACALTSEDAREMRGDRRVFVCATGVFGKRTYELRMDRESGRTRWEEDERASRLVLSALLDAAETFGGDEGSDGVRAMETPDLLREDGVLSEAELEGLRMTRRDRFPEARGGARAVVERWLALEARDGSNSLEFTGGELTAVGATRANVILSGSFNPLHEGHRELLAAATASAPPGALGAYEISVTNADKGALSLDEIMRRFEQFTDPDAVLVLTKEPLFVNKARVAPGASFVVGVDTAVRLLDPKYSGSDAALATSLDVIRANSCDFIVAGRLDRATGAFVSPDDVSRRAAAVGAAALFRPLPDFRVDLSSTEIRERASRRT